MTLADRLLAIHAGLKGAQVDHAFGGAIALAYWTSDPRGTSDIDVNVFVDQADCERALAALPAEIAIGPPEVTSIKATGQVRAWWHATPVDLFFDNLPVHRAAAKHRKTVPFEGESIPILGPLELALFKAMFDRTQDWADIEAMLIAETLDVDALRALLGELIASDDPRFARLDRAIEDAERRGPRSGDG